MFIVSLKPNIKKVLVISFIAIVLVFLFVFALVKTKNNMQTVRKVSSVTVKNNEERITFLKTFGWEVSSEPTAIREVAIPQEFDDVYNKYNDIQMAQGYNLQEFKGKRVKRWTYSVTNYPNKSDNINANILVYNNVVVGGDICTVALEGFMHGFALPK
ncbi:MAG: DUF4830 domain-containing protein [Oscillospiraceae bacterium]